MGRKLKWMIVNCLLLYFISVFSIGYGADSVNGVAIGEDVNVRQEPKIESGVMTTLQLGQGLNILGHRENWYEIQLEDGKNGWVYSSFVVLKDREKELIKKGIVDASKLNVREEPNQNGNVSGSLMNGEQVTILEEKSGWYYIAKNESLKGWVHADYIKIKSNDPMAQIKGDHVNVRKSPSLSGKVIDKLEANGYVSIIDFQDEWYQIDFREGQKGWVYKDYIELLLPGNDSNLPISRSSNRLANLKNMVTFSKKYLGKPYKWGASGPNSFDCSGFTSYVYKKSGITLPRTSSSQAKVGQKVSKDALMMGDLVFFDTTGKVDGKITHVGMYIGDGKFIHASSGKNARQVVVSVLNEGYYNKKYVTARRIY